MKMNITVFIDTIMVLFDELKVEHGGTVLDCILTLGKEVINTENTTTISYFVKGLIKLGFNYPGKPFRYQRLGYTGQTRTM